MWRNGKKKTITKVNIATQFQQSWISFTYMSNRNLGDSNILFLCFTFMVKRNKIVNKSHRIMFWYFVKLWSLTVPIFSIQYLGMYLFGSRMTSSNLLASLQALLLLLKYFSRTLSSVRSITLTFLGLSCVMLIRTTRRTRWNSFVWLANFSNPRIVLQQEMNRDFMPLLPLSMCSLRLVFERISFG